MWKVCGFGDVSDVVRLSIVYLVFFCISKYNCLFRRATSVIFRIFLVFNVAFARARKSRLKLLVCASQCEA